LSVEWDRAVAVRFHACEDNDIFYYICTNYKCMDILKTVGIRFTGEELSGEGVRTSERKLGEIKDIFKDRQAAEKMDPQTPAYRVASFEPMEQGTRGGIYMGITYLEAGKVGNEYFMTKGHFHNNDDSVEYYWGVKGHGALILMDRERNIWAEEMLPGTLHYIPAGVAHRVANIGEEQLVFAASWPSDAGHDYQTIAHEGFSARLLEIDGKPVLV